ncbi:MAG: biopolymer transporter ExbD [Bacteroidota bacterium]
MRRRPSRPGQRQAEVPTSSLADIAFLLLIFFLVTTTIDTDTGIYLELPPPLLEAPPPVNERNLLNILVRNDAVLIDGRAATVDDIRTEVARHVTNEGRDPAYADSPRTAIVSFKAARSTSYARYVDALDAAKLAYRDVRDAEARRLGAANYAAYRTTLPIDADDPVSKRYPVKLSLAEPDPR